VPKVGHLTAVRIAAVTATVVALVVPSVSAQLNQALHQDGWILAAAHAPGLHGSIWRTDLWSTVRRTPT